jgi:hypothetical protein
MEVTMLRKCFGKIFLIAAAFGQNSYSLTLNEFFLGHYHLHGYWDSKAGDHGHWHGWMELNRSAEEGNTFYKGHWSVHVENIQSEYQDRVLNLKFLPVSSYQAKVIDKHGKVVGEANCGTSQCTYSAVDVAGSIKETYTFNQDEVTVKGSMSTAGQAYTWHGHGHKE